MKAIKELITHDLKFHADESFAAVILRTLFPKAKFTRTRDITPHQLKNPKIIVFDVGFVYNKTLNNLDHHQKGGAGKRRNGIKYASFGLVWKHFGQNYLKALNIEPSSIPFIYKYIADNLAVEIDGMDNGQFEPCFYNSTVPATSLAEIVNGFNPLNSSDPEAFDHAFLNAQPICKHILDRKIEEAVSMQKAEAVFSKLYKKGSATIVLPEFMSWQYSASLRPDLKFVIIPKSNNKYSGIQVPIRMHSMQGRASFKEEFRGLEGAELQNVSGVKDAVFCHSNGFLAVCDSLDGIHELINLSLK